MKTKKDTFIMLITHTENNDSAAAKIAPADREIVYCKLRYVRPCDRFGEIKDIQKRLKLSSAVKGKYVTTVIDLSEWIGHENEQYLTVTMKFLHDMQDRTGYIFTVGDCKREKAEKLFRVARRYMRGHIEEDLTLTDRAMLIRYIQARHAEPPAAELIAEMISEPALKMLRSLPAINEMCDDILKLAAEKYITPRDVRSYAADESSLPYITDKATALKYAEEGDEDDRTKSDGQASAR